MIRRLSRWIFKMMGWKVSGSIPPDIKKYVLIMAPHTSFVDFYVGFFAFSHLKIKAYFLIKKEAFNFFTRRMLKWYGGIPVERGTNNKMVEKVSEIFREREKFALAITPEGTRKKVKTWRKGFYYIALRTGVPIIPGSLDYGTKTAFIDAPLYPTGNYEEDMKKIRPFYENKKGRHKDRFCLPA